MTEAAASSVTTQILEPESPRTDEGSLALAGEHRLTVERQGEEDVLRIEGPDGGLRLSVVVTPRGPEVRLEGSDLRIRSTGSLDIDAEHVAIRGRRGLTLRSDAEAELNVAGKLRTEARSQRIVARRADVSVYANDDVKLDGERIRMNC